VIKRSFAVVSVTAALALAVPGTAYAQSGASSAISGTVVDSAGGAIPGATVVARSEGGATFETVSNSEGVFSIPAVGAGSYTVTVSLAGFKTAVVSNVRVVPGGIASVAARLEVGQIEETVTVTSSTELINTQTAEVSATLNSDQLNRMPTPTRNALNALTFLPGINTAGTNRNSNVNGLPDSFMNVMLDGVTNNDQFLRSSDGFFASVTPRQDAIQAVTITTAVGGAQSGGSGAININFVTRSGSNRFAGTGYHYLRHTAMNSNYWFNKRNQLERNDIKLYQWGGRASGPISVPGLFSGRDKAFYMVHYEQLRFPNSFTRTRSLLHPRALDGWFRWMDGTTLRELNVLSLAAANGQIAATNPLVMSMLNRIQASTATTGTVSPTGDPLFNQYVWLSPGKLFEHQPTVRIDYNITNSHRLSGSAQYIYAERNPDYLNGIDARFPGAPNFRLFSSTRPLYSMNLRSTLTQNIVNEIQGGITQGGASYFGDDSSNGPQTFEDMGGYALAHPLTTSWFATNTPSWRSSWSYSVGNTLNWQRGNHALSFGGQALFVRAWERAKQVVPGISFGLSTTNDPARGLFNITNFPGASSADLGEARALYALLTGRVSAITGQAALDPDTGRYLAFAPRVRQGSLDSYGLFIQDSWRATPTLTLNAGIRWEVQTPFRPANNTMSAISMADACGISGAGPATTPFNRCNFFAPGATGGSVPEFSQFTAGTRGYQTDWDNFAPNVGIAWRPNVQSGWLRALLGDPDQATLRAGYSIAYDRRGMSDFTGIYGQNQGSVLSLSRTEAAGNLVLPGETWPVLLSQTNRLNPQPFPDTPTYPIAVRAGRSDSLFGFAPDLEVANAHTWTAGIQRAIGRNAAVDIRYVGTRGVDQWSTLNYNERDILGNGFFDEFQLAMANLQANNLAGGSRTGSFAYFGPGTGTSPLPIYLAYLNGRTNANDPAAYTGGTSTWTNTTHTTPLVRVNPNPFTAAANLDGNSSRRALAATAGLAPNLFVVNPHVSNVNITDSGAYSNYHALQIDLRRRMANGLQANINYQYALEGGSAFLGFRYGRVMNQTTDQVRHAIKTQWDWEVPVGTGQRFGSNMGTFANTLLGGWSFSGVGRIQARVVNFGNVRLVGMTAKDVQKLYKHEIRINPTTGLPTVYTMPDDIILNTRRAFSVSTTSATGYASLGVPEGRYFAPANGPDCIQMKSGDCADRQLIIRAPWFTRFDVGLRKRFPVAGQMNLEFALEVLNVLDNINFNQASAPGTGAGIFQVGSAYTDASNTYDPGGRLGQLMFRINW
jgi:hypothetical protein